MQITRTGYQKVRFLNGSCRSHMSAINADPGALVTLLSDIVFSLFRLSMGRLWIWTSCCRIFISPTFIPVEKTWYSDGSHAIALLSTETLESLCIVHFLICCMQKSPCNNAVENFQIFQKYYCQTNSMPMLKSQINLFLIKVLLERFCTDISTNPRPQKFN